MADQIRVLTIAGEQPLAQAVDEVEAQIGLAREEGIKRLLVDVRGLCGFASPDLLTRVGMVRRWSSAARGLVKVALVCHSDLIDSERFGVVIAQSMGFDGNVFENVEDARFWLEQTPALWYRPPPEF